MTDDAVRSRVAVTSTNTHKHTTTDQNTSGNLPSELLGHMRLAWLG